jgi:hypothetical protein
MKRALLLTFLCLSYLGFAGSLGAQEIVPMPKPEQQAVPAVEAWLALVDAGKYAESWKSAAAYLKNVVKEKQWTATMSPVRKPLGKLVSRKLKSAEFTRELPGAPDGEYVVIQFTTEFANKASATETVTPMKEKDGQWRVAGYLIK